MQLFSGKNEQTKERVIERILLQNYNRYYRLAYSYVHKEADAEDIVQNGAYRALRAGSTLKNIEYAETWVYRIMLNETFRYLKGPRTVSYEAILEEEGNELESTEDTYANMDLQRAMDALPAKDKAIIILRYFEDKKIEEIARIMNENVNTIKSRLYRSMAKLRMDLE